MTASREGGEVARFTLALPARADRCEIVVGDGLAADLPGLLARHAPAHAYAVIADDRVAELYGERLVQRLSDAGLLARLYRFPAGEPSKTVTTWAGIVEALAGDRLGRDACVIGLGGGVSCDLAGFVAASFLRGVPLVQVPTSLLAMVDAAVGGKTGVDLRAGKNLAGAFWHPRLVVADTRVLETLPEPELRGGLAEVVKHGAIADAAAFGWLEVRHAEVLRGDRRALAGVVADAVRVKASFVARDPLESGARAALNFGHTIAHALEHASDYRLPHGPAVAIGMVVECMIGEALGISEAGSAGRLTSLLEALGLPTRLPADADPERVLAATATDKKARGGRVRYTLIAAIGEVARSADGSWTHEVPDPAVLGALETASGAAETGESGV